MVNIIERLKAIHEEGYNNEEGFGPLETLTYVLDEIENLINILEEESNIYPKPVECKVIMLEDLLFNKKFSTRDLFAAVDYLLKQTEIRKITISKSDTPKHYHIDFQ